jgi:hypothetical protein
LNSQLSIGKLFQNRDFDGSKTATSSFVKPVPRSVAGNMAPAFARGLGA